MLFGIEQRGEVNDVIREILDVIVDRDLERIRSAAHQNIKVSQHENAKTYNLRRKAVRGYKIGDYVEIQNTETTLGVKKKIVIEI